VVVLVGGGGYLPFQTHVIIRRDDKREQRFRFLISRLIISRLFILLPCNLSFHSPFSRPFFKSLFFLIFLSNSSLSSSILFLLHSSPSFSLLHCHLFRSFSYCLVSFSFYVVSMVEALCCKPEGRGFDSP
jgi:hypothetical protein